MQNQEGFFCIVCISRNKEKPSTNILLRLVVQLFKVWTEWGYFQNFSYGFETLDMTSEVGGDVRR